MYDNNTPQGDNQQGNDEGFWPNVSGFKIGPTKNGNGQVIMFTINAKSTAKSDPVTFNEFMDMIGKAFHDSGGNGIRFVMPFRNAEGPRGPFQSATVKVFPNNTEQHRFSGNAGGGRRSYPTPQEQGYSQPQQNVGQSTRGPAAQRPGPVVRPRAPAPQVPPAQETMAPTATLAQAPVAPLTNDAGQATPRQEGRARQATRRGPGPTAPTAPTNASPSNPDYNEDAIPF